MMMRLAIEITTTSREGKVGTSALAELLYSLHRLVGAPDFFVLEGPPRARTVLWELRVPDQQFDAILTGQLVMTSPNPEEEY